jgi:hypothetical protein
MHVACASCAAQDKSCHVAGKVLKATSKKTGIPISVLIRCGVDWTIKKNSET